MESLVADPYVVTIAGGLVVAIVVGISTKSWSRLKHTISILVKKLDRPVVIRRSEHAQYLHAIEERHILFEQLQEERARKKKTENCLRNLSKILGEELDTGADAVELIEAIKRERDGLCHQVSCLASENEILKIKSAGTISNKVFEECRISGLYQSQCHQDIHVFFKIGEVFTPCYGDDGDPHEAKWILVGP